MGLQKDWDRNAGKAMWAAGHGDAEIAQATGVTQGTISYYRRRHWERECDAAPAEEQIPVVMENPDIEPDTSADVEVAEYECQAEEERPVQVELAIESPECEPERNEAEQKVTTYVPPSKEGPGAAKTEEVDTGYQHLIHALEKATGNLTGMDAVMTAQIITSLWGWTDKKDLLEAKACLDYLIRKRE